MLLNGIPGGIRTPDRRLRRPFEQSPGGEKVRKTALNNKELAKSFLKDLPVKYKQLPRTRLKKILMYAESYLHNLDKLEERNNHGRKQ